MTVCAIIQARMGSTRLPGKMALPLFEDRGALELMIERVGRSRNLNKVIVATTDLPGDDEIVSICEKTDTVFFRGSEEDVLDRYYQAALAHDNPEIIVRLTGDCPLHDPNVIDLVIEKFINSDVDFVCNNNPSTYPDGLDVEVFSFNVLEKAWNEAVRLSEREHVRMYMCNHPELFKTHNVTHSENLSHLRWTLDEQRDFKFIKKIYEALYPNNKYFTMDDILNLLENNRELVNINKDIIRDEGLIKTLQKENNASKKPPK